MTQKHKLINREHFASAKLHITLRNLVSQTVVQSNMKTIGNVPVGEISDINQIQLLEILPNGLALSVPRLTCAAGHQLEIEITATKLSKLPVTTKLMGKVKEVDKTSENQDSIIIELKSGSEKSWSDFCNLFAAKQEDITGFMKKIKGY